MSEASAPVTACLIIIGNEILSGRTVDANLPYIAQRLGAIGIRLAEVRIVADDEAAIGEALDACRARYRYVFTTGGIGPTHDDITAASVAKAFGRRYGRHPEAERRLLAYYPPERVNAARMKMADMPEGAELIERIKPDLAFVDLGLPVMSGFELARRIRRNPANKGTRLVALSGYGQDSDIRASIAAGFDQHLTKPPDPARLERMLSGTEPDPVAPLPPPDSGSRAVSA